MNRNKKLSGRALVIQPGSGEIRIASMRLGSASPKIKYSAAVPCPEGAVEDGMVQNPAGVRTALQEALKRKEFRHVRRAVLCLCSTRVLSETAEVAAVGSRMQDRMIETNSDLYFPVSTEGCRIVWTPAGTRKDDSGTQMLKVQLWAVPEDLLRSWYELASECNLYVEAVAWCGDCFALAVNESWAPPAAPKKVRKSGGKKAEKTAELPGEQEQGEEDDALLYLMADQDFLLLTFVRNGQIRLQRLLRGGSLAEQLDEARILMEVCTTVENLQGMPKTVLCGTLAEDETCQGLAEQALGVSVEVLDGKYISPWLLCMGASRTVLDFGVRTMNRKGRSGARRHIWQYAMIGAGVMAVAGSIGLSVATRNSREAQISALESTRDALSQTLAPIADYASNWDSYESSYAAYQTDWNSLLGTVGEDGVYTPGMLQTYNDNLSYMLEELEQKLPTSCSVTQIGIAQEGLGLQIACQSKEEAAYVIMTLRYGLEYGTLSGVSDLTRGSGVDASSMLPSLDEEEQRRQEEEQQNAEEEPPPEEEDLELPGEEPPPEGSAGDMDILDLVESAGLKDMSVDDMLALADVLARITPEDAGFLLEALAHYQNDTLTSEEAQRVVKVLMAMTPEDRRQLAGIIDLDVSSGWTLEELSGQSTKEQRRLALADMLQNPYAACEFGLLAGKDYDGEWIFWQTVADDLLDENASGNLSSDDFADGSVSPEVMQLMMELPVRDTENSEGAVALIRTDGTMSRLYAYYLTLELGLSPERTPQGGGGQSSGTQSTGTQNPGTDIPGIQAPVPQEPDSQSPGTQEPGMQQPGDEPEGGNPLGTWMELLKRLAEMKGIDVSDVLGRILPFLSGAGAEQDSELSLDDLMGLFEMVAGEDAENPGEEDTGENGGGEDAETSGGEQQQEDNRYYVTVSIAYRPDLIQAEMERKGLSRSDIVGELEEPQ